MSRPTDEMPVGTHNRLIVDEFRVRIRGYS